MAGSLIELIFKKSNKIIFWILFVVLTLMAMFGLKQGSDFYGYSYIYYHIPKISDFYSIRAVFTGLKNINLHGEIGFKIIISIFREFNFNYLIFEASCSLFLMLLLLRFIRCYCKYRCLALFLFLHTVYLTYFLSGVRQGVAMVCFLSVLLPMLKNKKLIPLYILFTLLLSTIHAAALSYLLLLIVFNIKTLKMILINPKIQIMLILLSYVFGFVLAKGAFQPVLSKILPAGVMVYVSGGERISYFSVTERLILFFVTLYLTKNYSNDDKDIIENYQLISFIGAALYGCTMFSPLVASRLCLMFKVAEIGIISNCLKMSNRVYILLSVFVIFYCLLMYFKNINSYISQRNMAITFKDYNYNSWVTKKYIVDYNKGAEKDFILNYYFK